MGHRETDEVWAGEELAPQGGVAGVTTDRVLAQTEPSAELAEPEVLARFPDLDAPRSAGQVEGTPRRWRGRLLSPRLSVRLLLGGAILLVLAAVLPFVVGRHKEPEGGTPPAPDATEAPTWVAQAGEPSETLPGSAGMVYESETSFSPDLPPLPDYLDASQIPSLESLPQGKAADDGERSTATDGNGWSAPAEHQSWTVYPPPSAEANQKMTVSGPIPVPAGVYADGSRGEYGADSRANLPTGQPEYTTPYGPVDPGVARLEGVIEGPAVRMTYDAARPGVY
jgi:hypothetical protein